jgi:hypothetical protein
MLFAVIVTFVLIKWPLQAVSEISALRRKRREKKQGALEEEDEQLLRKEEGMKDEEWYDIQDEFKKIGLLGYPMMKGKAGYVDNIAEELLEQADFVRKRITLSSGGSDHRMTELCAEAWLKKHGEKNIIKNRVREGIRKRIGVRGLCWEEVFRVRPDLVGEKYIMECKTGKDWDREFCYSQARNYLDLAAYERKKLVYMFWEPPPPDDWWWDLIKQLKANKVKVIDRYGNEIKCGDE